MFRTKTIKPKVKANTFFDNDDFKSLPNIDDNRRKRQNVSITLSKQNRDSVLMRKRRMIVNNNDDDGDYNDIEFKSNQSHVDIEIIKEMMTSSDIDHQKTALQRLRIATSLNDEVPLDLFDQMIEFDLVKYIIGFLNTSYSGGIKLDASWILINFAGGETRHTKCVMDLNIVSFIQELLVSPQTHENIKDNCIWILANILGDSCSDFCDFIVEKNMIITMINLVDEKSSTTFVRTIMWALSQFFSHTPLPDFERTCVMVPFIRDILMQFDGQDSIILSALASVFSLTSYDEVNSNDSNNAIISKGIMVPIVDIFLRTENISILNSILQTFSNISHGDLESSSFLLSDNVMNHFQMLLNHPKSRIRKAVCVILSNIAIEAEHKKLVINNGFISPLMNLLSHDIFNVQKEIVWILSNLMDDDDSKYVQLLVSENIIAAYCELLKECQNSETIGRILNGMNSILKVGKVQLLMNNRVRNENEYVEYFEECGAIEILESMERFENEKVQSTAIDILHSYFQDVICDDVMSDDNDSDSCDNNFNNNNSNNNFKFNF
jgi:hypothetical protein